MVHEAFASVPPFFRHRPPEFRCGQLGEVADTLILWERISCNHFNVKDSNERSYDLKVQPNELCIRQGKYQDYRIRFRRCLQLTSQDR